MYEEIEIAFKKAPLWSYEGKMGVDPTAVLLWREICLAEKFCLHPKRVHAIIMATVLDIEEQMKNGYVHAENLPFVADALAILGDKVWKNYRGGFSIGMIHISWE